MHFGICLTCGIGQLHDSPENLGTCAVDDSGNTGRHVGRRRRAAGHWAIAAVDDASQSGPNTGGDPSLQDNLVRMVRLQIDQEKVKETVEEERQKLQQLADEVTSAISPP